MRRRLKAKEMSLGVRLCKFTLLYVAGINRGRCRARRMYVCHAQRPRSLQCFPDVAMCALYERSVRGVLRMYECIARGHRATEGVEAMMDRQISSGAESVRDLE